MKSLSRRAYALGAIVLAVVLFVAVNIVSNTWLGTARLDQLIDKEVHALADRVAVQADPQRLHWRADLQGISGSIRNLPLDRCKQVGSEHIFEWPVVLEVLTVLRLEPVKIIAYLQRLAANHFQKFLAPGAVHLGI